MINTVTINVERYDELRKYEEAYSSQGPIVFDLMSNYKHVYICSESDLIKYFRATLLEKNNIIDQLKKELYKKPEQKKKWWQKLFK